jgi:hypothetical protein
MPAPSKAPKKSKSKAAPTAIDTSATPKAAPVLPSVVETLAPVVISNALRKKELLELVAARSGRKKKDVKPVVEAMLAVLGDALAAQRALDVQPLGRMKVQRGKELADGRALVLKLRQKSTRPNAAPDAAPDLDTAAVTLT